MNRCEKPRPHRNSIPGPQTRSQSLYRLRYHKCIVYIVCGETALRMCVKFWITACIQFLTETNKYTIARCSAVQFYLSHRHVSVTLVTIFRVSNSKNTSNILVDKLQISTIQHNTFTVFNTATCFGRSYRPLSDFVYIVQNISISIYIYEVAITI